MQKKHDDSAFNKTSVTKNKINQNEQSVYGYSATRLPIDSFKTQEFAP